MKRIDIRFKQETDKKKSAAQLEMIAKLSERLPLRIAEKYDDVNVRVRLSTSGGYELTGFKDSKEREKFLEFLEELWHDDSLIE